MSVDTTLSLVYGVIVPNETLERLLQDFPSEDTETTRDLILFGPGQDFYKRWAGLGAESNVDWVSGTLPDALVVYVRSTYFSLIDGINRRPTAFPLALSRLKGPSPEEQGRLGEFCDEYGISAEPEYILVARIS